MTTALRKGAKGTEVRTLQETLAKQGQTLKPDGHFGPTTDLALRNYQRQQGLLADGIAGPRTLHALGIKATSHPPKKTPKENLQDILNRVGLSPAQSLAAQNAKPIAGKSQNPKLMKTSRDGLRFLFVHEAQKNKSNRLHWPGAASGVTLGPGYDLKTRKPSEVKNTMLAIGLKQSQAESVAEGIGLTGEDAKYFCIMHHEKVNLSAEQESQLLGITVTKYEHMVANHVTADLMQYEYDALVAFTYNTWSGIIPVAHLINSGKIIDAMIAMKRRIVSNNAVVPGLMNRREDEVNLYLFQNYGRI